MIDSPDPKTHFKLDPVGEFYASVRSRKYPASYSITVYLKATLDPQLLQAAVNDTMARIPHANVVLKRNFFRYYHELASTPLLIEPSQNPSNPCDYYAKVGERMLRVLYGDSYFTVEVVHSLCDGRGLSALLKALMVRYFELQGVQLDKTGIIDCSRAVKATELAVETEDAWTRADAETPDSKERLEAKSEREKEQSKQGTKVKVAYRPQRSHITPPQVSTQIIDLETLKPVAKKQGASINEYLLAHIFMALARERREQLEEALAILEDKALPSKLRKQAAKQVKACALPITITVPIDARNFLPSKTLLNFVVDKDLVMAETDNFEEILDSVKEQFKEVDKDYVLDEVLWAHQGFALMRWWPRAVQSFILRAGNNFAIRKHTAMFSNLGLFRLPSEIEQHIQMLEFIIGDSDMPYVLTCISTGSVMTITTTSTTKDCKLAHLIHHSLENL